MVWIFIIATSHPGRSANWREVIGRSSHKAQDRLWPGHHDSMITFLYKLYRPHPGTKTVDNIWRVEVVVVLANTSRGHTGQATQVSLCSGYFGIISMSGSCLSPDIKMFVFVFLKR